MSEITTTAAYLIVNSVGDIVARTANATPSVLVDLDEDGAVVGIEAIGRAIGVDELLDAIRWLRAPAPTSPSEPVPSTPRVPGSTERPEGISAEILDISRWPVTSAKRRAIRYVLTGVKIPAGLVIGGLRFDSETGALSWSQDSTDGTVTAAPTPRVWAMPEIPEDVSAVRESDGDVWHRSSPGFWETWRDDMIEGVLSEADLLARGPLTEVEETNDAD